MNKSIKIILGYTLICVIIATIVITIYHQNKKVKEGFIGVSTPTIGAIVAVLLVVLIIGLNISGERLMSSSSRLMSSSS